MDTRTRTASPSAETVHVKQASPPPAQSKISAYYSLVFPHFTFYIQTLSITIGRRCAQSATTSSSVEYPQVDVDLGALKSVSRLHAKIEYDQHEDRFVLVVVGRNGAWVDGVWCGAGTRSPLGERSQIQIASRLFQFVLPPVPPPEDTPSPSSQSSPHRQRSPSVDITSISPPSSQPSHSPPPREVKLPPPSPQPQVLPKQRPKAAIPSTRAQLPNSNSISKPTKSNAKKRKKGDEAPIVERPKPEIMPPKPPFTYAQLIYRAIKDIGGKATLQEICNWIMKNHEYYQYADAAWMSSVRHNLSSSRAFLKGERCGGERGKGFFWSVNEQFAQTLEEQEMKARQAAAAAAQGLQPNGETKSKKRDKNAPLEPPLKRSIKGDTKGAPLPPPLTSLPLSFKAISSSRILDTGAMNSTDRHTNKATRSLMTATTNNPSAPVVSYPSHPGPVNGLPSTSLGPSTWVPQGTAFSQAAGASTLSHTTSLSPSVATQAPVNQLPVPDVIIPIVLGPIPETHPDYAPGHVNNSVKEGYMILHERKLILDPDVFGELTQEMLEQLEQMGAPTALSILTGHMIRALKERRARDRGRDRGLRRLKGSGRGGTRKMGPHLPVAAPFTNLPLDQRMSTEDEDVSKVVSDETRVSSDSNNMVEAAEVQVQAMGPGALPDPGSPIIDIDGESEEDGPVAKKRKVESNLPITLV